MHRLSTEELNKKWIKLEWREASQLHLGFLEVHHATQFLPMVARAYLAPMPGEDHLSMLWDPEGKMFLSHRIDSEQTISIGLQLDPLTIKIISPSETFELSFPLIGKTRHEVFNWLRWKLMQGGFDASQLNSSMHYQIPEHITELGEVFSFRKKRHLHEIGAYYSNAGVLLEMLKSSILPASTAVLSRPEHLNMGITIELNEIKEEREGHSIVLGLSPPDRYCDEPYFYLRSQQPVNLGSVALPTLPYGARWNHDEWTGCILPGSELSNLPTGQEQAEGVARYYVSALEAFRDFYELSGELFWKEG